MPDPSKLNIARPLATAGIECLGQRSPNVIPRSEIYLCLFEWNMNANTISFSHSSSSQVWYPLIEGPMPFAVLQGHSVLTEANVLTYHLRYRASSQQKYSIRPQSLPSKSVPSSSSPASFPVEASASSSIQSGLSYQPTAAFRYSRRSSNAGLCAAHGMSPSKPNASRSISRG